MNTMRFITRPRRLRRGVPRVAIATVLFPCALLIATAALARESSTAEAPQLVVDAAGFYTDVWGLAFSPDGKQLAAAGAKEVRVWDLATGELLATLRGQRSRSFGGNCYAVSFSADGKFLVVGVDDYGKHGSIRIYRTSAWDKIDSLLSGNETPTKRLAFSAHGKFLAAATENGEVLVYDWPARKIISRVPARESRDPSYQVFNFVADDQLMLKDGRGYRVVGVPSGKVLAPADLDASVRDWIESPPPAQAKTLTSAADLRFDTKRSLLASFSDQSAERSYRAETARLNRKGEPTSYLAHRGRISAAAISPDGDSAATADIGGEIHVWDAANAKPRHVFRSRITPIYRAAFTSEPDVLALATKAIKKSDFKLNHYGDANRRFSFGDRTLSTTRCDGQRTEELERNGRRLSVEVLEGGRAGVICTQRGAKQPPYRVRPGASPTCITFADAEASDLKIPVVVGDDGGALCVFDASDGADKRWFIGHESFITSVSVSESGRQLLTSSTDGTIRLWPLDQLRALGEPDFDYVSNRVERIDRFSSAYRAGVRAGDEILGIDDYSLSELEELFLSPEYPYGPGDRAQLHMKRGDRKFSAFAAMRAGPDGVEPLLTLFLTQTGDWIVWTPEGYYDASPGADRFIGWHVNRGADRAAEFSTVQQFWRELYRPDVIKHVLEIGDTKQAIAKADAERGRTQPPIDLRNAEQYKRLAPPVSGGMPEVTQTDEAGRVRVQATFESQNEEPITEMTVLVNGRPVATTELAADSTERKATLDEQIELPPGENRVSVVASNTSSYTESPVTRVVSDAKATGRPRLFVLAVGISEYANQEKNLQFAHLDAREFASAMQKQRRELYDSVEVKVLVNADATRKGVLNGLQWLVDSATPNDVSMVFFSTHGIVGEDGDFYLCTHEVKGDNLFVTTVPGDILIDTLGKVKGRLVVFADACQSAGLGRLVNQDAIVRRVVTPEVGAVLFASSLPRQVSVEDPSWQHGAFSKAILDSLADRTTDSSPEKGDGLLSIGEFSTAIAQRVKQLTDDQQQAVTSAPTSLQNFNFVELLE